MKTSCLYCNKEIESSVDFCPYCGKKTDNGMIETLFKYIGSEVYYQKVRKMNEGVSLSFSDNKHIDKFWKIFIIPLLQNICKEQRILCQKFYEDTMGVEYENAPFDFENDVKQPEIYVRPTISITYRERF